ncbi:MAG: hypothetical protein K0Q55_3116 [Verrucomicrobia bacterium]|jgi:hypothetical protein|nr:hypothetical protein [Verrucomicrobiota bacterium]
MRYQRLTLFSAAGVLFLLVATMLVHRSTRQDQTQIQARYQQMLAALSANDTNAALALVASPHRRRFDGFGPSAFNYAAKPLGSHSSIRVSGDEAAVCPERPLHFFFLPVGDTIDMIKVNGDWFFTGDVHID